jgi:hypothetical protein
MNRLVPSVADGGEELEVVVVVAAAAGGGTQLPVEPSQVNPCPYWAQSASDWQTAA